MNTFKQCDYYNIIHTAEEEARAKGLAEGRKDIILKMRSANMSVEQISTITEFTPKEIQAILDSAN